MKAEIGIRPDGAPYLTLIAETSTECTLVDFFADRLGIVVANDGYYRIQGAVPPPAETPR